MTTKTIEELRSLDRQSLISRMAEELPGICESLGINIDTLAEKTGVEAARLKAVETGGAELKWSEYLSILFVIWNNNVGQGLLESRGLFPEELKKAMSVNRNAHAS